MPRTEQVGAVKADPDAHDEGQDQQGTVKPYKGRDKTYPGKAAHGHDALLSAW